MGTQLPHLNPLDYYVWSEVERKANAHYHSSVDVMKAKVEEEWANIPADTLRSVCLKFRARLELCIAAEGGIFEKK